MSYILSSIKGFARLESIGFIYSVLDFSGATDSIRHRLSHTACPKASLKALGLLVKSYHIERKICEIKTIYNGVKLAFVPIFFTVNKCSGRVGVGMHAPEVLLDVWHYM